MKKILCLILCAVLLTACNSEEEIHEPPQDNTLVTILGSNINDFYFHGQTCVFESPYSDEYEIHEWKITDIYIQQQLSDFINAIEENEQYYGDDWHDGGFNYAVMLTDKATGEKIRIRNAHVPDGTYEPLMLWIIQGDGWSKAYHYDPNMTNEDFSRFFNLIREGVLFQVTYMFRNLPEPVDFIKIQQLQEFINQEFRKKYPLSHFPGHSISSIEIRALFYVTDGAGVTDIGEIADELVEELERGSGATVIIKISVMRGGNFM